MLKNATCSSATEVRSISSGRFRASACGACGARVTSLMTHVTSNGHWPVTALPCPNAKKERQSGLGLVRYLREHIPWLVSSQLILTMRKRDKMEEDQLGDAWRKLMNHFARSIATL